MSDVAGVDVKVITHLVYTRSRQANNSVSIYMWFILFFSNSYRLNLEMEENTCLRKNVRRGVECDVIT